jgi:TetR/AcrR family transcriptional repressor of nem operon
MVAAASELLRAKGFDAVSVAEVANAVGLTHGGFYNHFASKDDLAAQALADAWASMSAHRSRAGKLPQLLAAYLSPKARDAPGKGCPAAALAGDVRRQPHPVRHAFATGLEEMINSLEGQLAGDPATRRTRAVALATRMIGALLLSRSVPDDEPLARELLSANLEMALSDMDA